MRSIIFGIPGQDSYFLAKLLIERGDELIGCHRQSYTTSFPDFAALGKISFKSCDLNDYKSLETLIQEFKPDEIYNLAANSFVGDSFVRPAAVISNNINGHVNLLEAIRHNKPDCKIYYAGSSEEIHPTSPYGVSKRAVKELNDIYRNTYGMFIVHAQNFNHSSWRHSDKFLFGKVTKYVAYLRKWLSLHRTISIDEEKIYGEVKSRTGSFSVIPKLELGNLGAYRDISYAGDVMKAAVLMMSLSGSGTTRVASGTLTKTEDFVKLCFVSIGEDYKKYISFSSELLRPAESIPEVEECLFLRSLGWKPSVTLKELISNTIDEYISRGLV